MNTDILITNAIKIFFFINKFIRVLDDVTKCLFGVQDLHRIVHCQSPSNEVIKVMKVETTSRSLVQPVVVVLTTISVVL
jgi:hypothetical protein